MLYQNENGKFLPWNCGVARVFTNHRSGYSNITIGVYCEIGSMGAAEVALLDTGATWTVLSEETAELIQEELGTPIGPVRISTRHGMKVGYLHRVGLRLLADQGQDLRLECTCAVLEDWVGPTVLGWNSLLDRINFALHPDSGPEDASVIYFGLAT